MYFYRTHAGLGGMMTCDACDHERILNDVSFHDDDSYWLDTIEELGHVCNDYNCPHTCDLEEYN